MLLRAQSETATVLHTPNQSTERGATSHSPQHSLLSVVVQDPRRNRELRLRTQVRHTLHAPNGQQRSIVTASHQKLQLKQFTHLPEHPPVHEQQRPVRLRVLCLELEPHQHVRVPREVELERRHEEPHARLAPGEALGEVARGPVRGVEPWEVPALPLAEEAAFVQHAAHLVREAASAIRVNRAAGKGARAR